MMGFCVLERNKRMAIIKKGDKYNRLTAIKFSHRDKRGHQYWLFKCDCGNENVILVSNVKRGTTKACGCLLKTHGMHGTKTYWSWAAMKDRCLNKNNPEYKHYGGRGIKVCNEWVKFENFYKDMGECPPNKTLDRIDNSKGYYKENCRWANLKEQNNNKRTNHLITYKGKTQTISQWARELNLGYKCLSHRINRGWKIERALTTKIKL